MQEGFFDKFVAKFISRKFLVWIFATTMMLIGVFTKFAILKSEDWVVISAIYIGGQTCLDIALAFKGKTSTVGSFIQNNVLSAPTTIPTKTTEQEDKTRPTSFGGMQ